MSEKPFIVTRLIEMLDYALNESGSDELLLEVNIQGASYEVDERDDLEPEENPGGMFNEEFLGDMGMLVTEEFSTSHKHRHWDSGSVSFEDIKFLRALLTADKSDAAQGVPTKGGEADDADG